MKNTKAPIVFVISTILALGLVMCSKDKADTKTSESDQVDVPAQVTPTDAAVDATETNTPTDATQT